MLIGRRCEHPGDVAADRGSHHVLGATGNGASDDCRGADDDNRADNNDPDDNDHKDNDNDGAGDS